MDSKADLDALIASLETDLEGDFENRLRSALEAKDRAWLVGNLLRHLQRERHLEKTSRRQLTRHAEPVEPVEERRLRLDRIQRMKLDAPTLRKTLDRFRTLDREALVSQGLLIDPPHKGKEALGPQHRNAAGEALLQEARDLFYALLFGDDKLAVKLPRDRRDFLTVTLPSAKSGSLERFLLAVTELPASGTWLDPEGVSDDVGAANTLLQVEFGDSNDGLISDGLLVTLGLLNNLEVNEEILYARIEALERSTLVG